MEDKETHTRMTAKGTFYDRNGGRFKGKNHMTRDEELQYAAKINKETN